METRTIAFLPCETIVYKLKDLEIIEYLITNITIHIEESRSAEKASITYKATNGPYQIFFNNDKIGSEVFLDKKDIIKKLVNQL